jgi:hypothetical protein
MMEFDLGGLVRLTSELSDPSAASSLAALMDPYAPLSDQRGAAPSVALTELHRPELTELQLRTADGLVTGWDGNAIHGRIGRGWVSIPDAAREEPARIGLEQGASIGSVVRQVARPALQLRSLASGAVAMHAAAVVHDGGAVLVAGWSETGKTETALTLVEDGARFLTDKWTLVSPSASTATPFPISVGVRRWVLPYLPSLRSALPGRARLQLAFAGAAGAVSSPIRRAQRRRGGLVREGLERAVALADRAALSPREIAGAYGHEPICGPVPLRLVVALRTVPGTDVSAAAATNLPVLARRFAVSAQAERDTYWAYRRRAAYSAGRGKTEADDVLRREVELIRSVLGAVPVVEVSAPFPTDPRRVAAAIEPWLRAG